jgi:predicted aspartyl protease
MGGGAAMGAAILLALCGGGAAEAACQANRVAALPVTMSGLTPTVSVRINGTPATMTVDTGAAYSVLFSPGARRFNLYSRSLPLESQGFTGELRAGLGVAEELVLGRDALHHVDFLLISSGLDTADGMLGENVLGRFDTEVDLANGAIRLWWPAACGDAMPADWPKDGSVSTISYAERTSLDVVGEASVNGRPIRAMFDTGASQSIMTGPGAERAGIDFAGPGVRASGPVRGFGAGAIESWTTTVGSFSIGHETIKNAQLRVSHAHLGDVDIILGMDFFLSHRVLISRSQHKIYFLPNGRPVFQLEDTEAMKPASAAPAGKDGLDTDALLQRAKASAARGELASAIADFSRVIELGRGEAQPCFYRALTRWRAGHRSSPWPTWIRLSS